MVRFCVPFLDGTCKWGVERSVCLDMKMKTMNKQEEEMKKEKNKMMVKKRKIVPTAGKEKSVQRMLDRPVRG